jgi:acyl carrier protein
MERSEILAKVIQVVRGKLGLTDADVVEEKTSFAGDLHTDSLDLSEIVMEFEDAFDIKISDDEAKTVKTIGDATDAIKKILDARQ